MVLLVCYDVDTREPSGSRRLRRIAEACKDYGVRVQYSLFECRIEAKDWVVLKARLLSEFDAKQDSLRFYYLDEAAVARTDHHGIRKPLDVTGPLVV